MSNKHIPGSWRAMRWWESAGMTLDDADDAEQRAYFEASPIKLIEAADGTCVVACHDLAEIEPEIARLIVAAPELLEACRAALGIAWETGCETEDGVKTLLDDSRGDLFRKLSSAIAKATQS